MVLQILVVNDFETGLEIKTEKSMKLSWLIAPQRKREKSNVQPHEIERNISSPVSFERLYHQSERCQSHLGTRLLSLA